MGDACWRIRALVAPRASNGPRATTTVVLGSGRSASAFIHQPQQVMVLRRGGKEVEVLFANGQKHPRWLRRQAADCGLERGHMGPVITHTRLPRGPLQGTQATRPPLHRPATALWLICAAKGWVASTTWVTAFAADVIDKPCDTAEPAQPLGQTAADTGRAVRPA